MLCLFSSGSQAARGAAKRGRNERGEAADVGGRIFSRCGADMGALRGVAAPVGAASGVRAQSFFASFGNRGRFPGKLVADP